jgi:tetratricopeptide (TPR) repeat protein
MASIPPPLPPRSNRRVPVRPVVPIPVKPESGALPWFIGGGVVLLILAVAGFVVFRSAQSHALPARENVTVQEKHEQTKAAFVENDAAAGSADTPVISAALDRFNNIIIAGDPASADSVFDVNRLVDELERMGALDSISADQRAGFKRGIAEGARKGLVKQCASLIWTGHKVKKVSLSSDRREAVVYDLEQHFGGTGTSRYISKMRLWLRNDDGVWKIWDFEDLNTGMRVSSIIASMVGSVGGSTNIQAMQSALVDIKAMPGFVQARDWPALDRTLKRLDSMSLPVEFVAVRYMFHAVSDVKQDRYERALKECDAVDATGQDMPIINEFRSQALNHLGRYDEALVICSKWEDALGGDLELYYERGCALEGLKRTGEAIDAFGKSMDEDPDALGAMEKLARLLPADQKSEAGRRLSLCKNPHAMFIALMRNMQKSRDLAGMGIMIDAYAARPESAGDEWFIYYKAELKILQKNYRQGELLLQPILADAGTTAPKATTIEYYYAAALAGDSMNVYRAAADKKFAFTQLASRDYTQGYYIMLGELVTAQLAHNPNDPWVLYYQACVQQNDGNYSAADNSYAKAMSLSKVPADVTHFLNARLYGRYAAGTGVSAYQQIEPKDQVFKQLAYLFSKYKQGENLAKLVALRKADVPTDASLPLWDADAKFLAGDYEDAVATLSTITPSDGSNKDKWNNLYIRSQIRLKHFDAARVVADKSAVDPVLVAAIECNAGNVPAAIKALNLAWDNDEDLGTVYADPDIGPAIATPAFADWRASHPNPAAQPDKTATTTPAQ